jgi:ATP-dependent Clp protease adaptor protein ClpS
MNQVDEEVVLERRSKVKKPPRYKVVLLNDDFTPFEFVISLLCKHFQKSLHEAENITLTVHQEGSGIVHIYPSKDVAEMKAKQANSLSREQGFPLKCVTEKE